MTERCTNCLNLRKFELTDDLYTCATLNIRLHAETVKDFGCTLFEPDEKTQKSDAVVDSLRTPLASVGSALGRWYLDVAGMTIAVEADPLRCTKFQAACWRHADLQEACDRINAAAR